MYRKEKIITYKIIETPENGDNLSLKKLIEGREIEPWVCFRKNYNMSNDKKRELNGIENNAKIFVLAH